MTAVSSKEVHGVLVSQYSRASSLFFNAPLALLPSKAEEIRAFWQSKLAGATIDLSQFKSNQEPLAARLFAIEEDDVDETEEDGVQRQGKVAVIPLHGVMSQRMNLMTEVSGGTSTEMFGQLFSQLMNDPEVRSIVIDIDSPGGSSYGVTELASLVLGARGQKPILAVANSTCCSAAYWVGAAADRLYSTPGGLVGSVGVYMHHIDASKWEEKEGLKTTFIKAGEHKVRGNDSEPLSDDDIAHFQSIVDETYGRFVRDVARGRGVPVETVKASYGKGDVLTATQALKAGMVDGIKTLGEVVDLAATAKKRPLAGATKAESEEAIQPAADVEGMERLGRMRLRSIRARAAAGAA